MKWRLWLWPTERATRVVRWAVLAPMLVIVADLVLFAAFAAFTGINWGYALSAAEVSVGLALSGSLLLALHELELATRRPEPHLFLAFKELSKDATGSEWEVVLANTGDESADSVRVWMKVRRPETPTPSPVSLRVPTDQRWQFSGDGYTMNERGAGEATFENFLEVALPRYRGHATLVSSVRVEGVLEVTAQCMNSLREEAWDTTKGERPLPSAVVGRDEQ